MVKNRSMAALVGIVVTVWATPSRGQAVVGQTAPILELSEAVAEALARNDRVVDAQDSIRTASLSQELALSAFTPKILPNLRGSIGQTDLSNQRYGVGFSQLLETGTRISGNLDAITSQNQFGNYTNSDVTLQASQSLLRGFGRTVTRRDTAAASRRADGAARSLRLTEQQVAVDVASAYYRLVAGEQLLRVATQGRTRSVALMEASRARLRVGRLSRLDVLRTQQLVAEGDLRVLNAQTAVDEAADQLRMLMLWAPERGFRVISDIPAPGDFGVLSEATAMALANRAEVALARAAIDDAERSAAVARNALLPQLDAGVAVTRRETADRLGASFGLDRFRFATFFEMSTPIDRTPQRVALQSALIEVRRRQRDLEAQERQIQLEVRSVHRQAARVQRALELSESRVGLARQELEAATYRYGAGLADTFDMVTAETNLLAAEAAELGLRSQLAIAWLRLRAALGVLDPRRDIG